jgi:steroid delta-isomerase-like uncharacterized protein
MAGSGPRSLGLRDLKPFTPSTWKNIMDKYLLLFLGLILSSAVHGEDKNTYKKDVTLWYDAFTQNNPLLLDRILDDNWVDIPAPPGQPAGPAGAKEILVQLTTTFADLKITIQDILQDGDKVVVRSEISGTQRANFMAFPAKNRKMTIMAVDIHEFKDGRIIRTWHTEDWLTGFRQLGIFE